MISISTESFNGYGLNRIFGFVKEAGFDALDIAMDPRTFDTIDTEYVKSLVNEYKLPVQALLTHTTANEDDVIHAVEMAKEIGTRIIVVQPPKMFNFKYTKWLEVEVPKIRQREDISIALQNATDETFLGVIPEHSMNNINDLRKFKHAALDTTRVALKHDDLIRTFELVKKFLVHVHVSNLKKGIGYALPDEGILPLESFLTKLRQDGYKGAVSFKINPKFMQVGNHAKMMKHLAACKKFYEDFYVKVPVVSAIEAKEDKEE